MGRRLTALRVREMELARQCTVQQSELHELRLYRIDLQEEAHQAQVEAAAEIARLERDRRELMGRYEQAEAALDGMAPKEHLEVERKEKMRFLEAYRALAEQASRCAGAEADAVRHELEASMLSQQLKITEAALSITTRAADDLSKAIENLASGGGRGHERTDVLALEARIQKLLISETSALSRAEAAEKVLEEAIHERRKLTERLAAMEQPVAELIESKRVLQEDLDRRIAEIATLKSKAASHVRTPLDAVDDSGSGNVTDLVHRLRSELSHAKEDMHRAKEFEHIATLQVQDLSSRQAGILEEANALREMLTSLQKASDESVEAGQLQWGVLQARRAEGEARRREALAKARQGHLQTALYRLRLATASHETQLHKSRDAAREARVMYGVLHADYLQLNSEAVKVSAMAALADKVREAAQRSAEASRQAQQLTAEREVLYTELEAYAARDEEQRLLINMIATSAEKGEHAALLEPPERACVPLCSATGKQCTSIPAAAPTAMAMPAASALVTAALSATDAAAAPPPPRELTDSVVVKMVSLAAEKTDLKVAELRLKRRVAALELSEMRALETANEASSRAETYEVELVHAKACLESEERRARDAEFRERQASSRIAELTASIAHLEFRLEIAAAKKPRQSGTSEEAVGADSGCRGAEGSDGGSAGRSGGESGGGSAGGSIERVGGAGSNDHGDVRSSIRHSGQGIITTPPQPSMRLRPGSCPSSSTGFREQSRCDASTRPGSVRRPSTLGQGNLIVSRCSAMDHRGADQASIGSLPTSEMPAGEGTAVELAALEAHAQLSEVSAQLHVRDWQQSEMEDELRSLRFQLSAVRAELATSEDALLRAEARFDIQMAHRNPASASQREESSGGGSFSSSPLHACTAAMGHLIEDGEAQRLLTERAELEIRHTHKLSLAEESVRAVQDQLRRKDAEIAKLQSMLAQAREIHRQDKAEAAVATDALSERLESRNEEIVTCGFAALDQLNQDAEPVARGSELTVREIENESERNQSLIAQLHSQLSGTTAELQAARTHIKTLAAQLETEKLKAPLPNHRVAQLTATVRGKERELTKLRDALATLKDEMSTVAAEHSERMARVSERAVRAEARAQAESQASERMSVLQEKLLRLTEQVQGAKHREEEALKRASDAAMAMRNSDAIASRASAEIVRLNSELASFKAQMALVPSREEALKQQLAARTSQLEELHRRLQQGTMDGDDGDDGKSRDGGGFCGSVAAGEIAAAVAEAVAKAVEAERQQRASAQNVAEDIHFARELDQRQRATQHAELASSAATLRDAERMHVAAVQQAAQLQSALLAAEAEIQRLKSLTQSVAAVRAEQIGEAHVIKAASTLRRSRETGLSSSCAATTEPVSPSADAGIGGPSCLSGGGKASSIALERWAAEKKLRHRVETLRAKLSEKTNELSAAEGELAKARHALDAAHHREQAMREGMVHAQEQLARMERDRVSSTAGAVTSMRSREELSSELHECQRQLAQARAVLRTQHSLDKTANEERGVGACQAARASYPRPDAEGPEYGGEEDEKMQLRASLLQRDQRILELEYSVEAHELTVAQLQARLRDQAAYQSLLAQTSGSVLTSDGGKPVSEEGALTRLPARLSRAGAGETDAASGSGGNNPAKADVEIAWIVEKMKHVIQNLQRENAELRNNVASNAKRVELRRELSQKATDELRAKVTETKSASARGDADRATKLARELAETRRQLKDERAELQVLRSKLVETQEGRTWAEEALSAAKHPAAPPQIARAHAELEEQLRAARSEVCDLRQEVVEKVNLLVSVSLQLSEALEAATTAERRTAEVEEQLVPQREIEALLRDSEKRREELAAALEEKTLETELLRQQLGQLESRTASRCGGGSAGTSDSFATTNPRASETATTEKAALTEELSGLSPQFFEEIEDLKYAYAVVRTSLGRYERAYGPLPASGEEP